MPCRVASANRSTEYYNRAGKARRAAQHVGREVRTYEKVCLVCAEGFSSRSTTQKYCSGWCRNRRGQYLPGQRPATVSTGYTKSDRPKHWYGHKHRLRRRMLLPHAYDQPCPLCGALMLHGQALDLDHSVPLSLDEESVGDRITHATCNRSRRARIL